MHTKTLLATFLLSAIVVSTPVPGQNVPITDTEWAALKAGGLQARGQNVPITDSEWAALEAIGLSQRDFNLQARDNVMNCGDDITGDISIGGNHVGWVPWAQFNTSTQEFCQSYTGSDISKGHETSDTYPVFLTNQDNPAIHGAAGNVVFAIYNTMRDPTYIVDAATCMMAMEAPILAYLNKGHKNGKGDQCYGSLNNDYEGGYYLVDGIGAFGSEVRAASS